MVALPGFAVVADLVEATVVVVVVVVASDVVEWATVGVVATVEELDVAVDCSGYRSNLFQLKTIPFVTKVSTRSVLY